MAEKEKLDLLVEFQKAVKNKKVIGLFGEINEDVAMSVISALITLDKKGQTITMLIDSPGGSVGDGIAIIDTMRGMKSKIHTIIMGEACSMAGYIALWGDRRSITEHSYWMTHPVTDGIEDYVNFVKDRAKYLCLLEDMLTKMLKQRTKLNEKDIQKAIHGELWLNACQCVDKGICNSIVTKSFIRR